MKIKVGEIIKAKREEKGYSLVEFAKMVNISAGYLSQIENGKKNNPNLDIILKIIDELDIDIAMLLGLETSEESYLSRIPSLIKFTLAKERNLNTLSEPEVLRKFNAIAEKILEANYILNDKRLYMLFLEDVGAQMDILLKRYMALQILQAND
ncbi:MAG: helix-turn-helix transcriptional regulator [Clostridiaceae bacterium]|nr:helix-turn-helix transcriptional regulator [Clostridiaceae bacterium]